MDIKKILAIGIIILFFGTYINTTVFADNVKKSPIILSNSNTLYVGGTGEGNYTHIQDAIDNSSNGDTIYVYSGIYFENVVVNKAINLIGENKNTTIIDGSEYGDVVFISSDWINMSGFTIRNSGDEWHVAGINISSICNSISGNVFSDNKWGILLNKCSNNIVTDNIIISNNHGIKIFESNSNTIICNKIILNDNAGIEIFYSNNNIITKNNISLNDDYGIWPVNSNNNTISGNKINNNGYWGDMISYGGGIKVDTSNGNIFSENEISNNCLFGIFIGKSSSNKISGNTIVSNELWGINVESCSNYNTIESNNISKTYLCLVLVDSNNNIVIKNNFLKKGNRVSFSNCTNIWKENYWNRPRILPKLIFGFGSGSNLWIPRFNIDWHPAKEPYDI